MSSSAIDQSKTSAFSLILSGLDDLGIVIKPFCTLHLSISCAGVLLYLEESNIQMHLSRLMTKWHVHPVKTKMSLGIRPVWSKSSQCAQWEVKDPSFLHADSEDSDQTGRMPRLIWVFAGRTCHFVGFVMRRLICSPGSDYQRSLYMIYQIITITLREHLRAQKALILTSFLSYFVSILVTKFTWKSLINEQVWHIVFKIFSQNIEKNAISSSTPTPGFPRF